LLAVASVTTGVFAFSLWGFGGLLALPAGIAAILLGALGLYALRHDGQLRGRGLAWGGVLAGAVFLAAAFALNGSSLTGTGDPVRYLFMEVAPSTRPAPLSGR
jgi:4-amino-4-deoxy-L-arabinose transferase-like glycosyltransferase